MDVLRCLIKRVASSEKNIEIENLGCVYKWLWKIKSLKN